VGSWLRGPLHELSEDVFLGSRARSRGYFEQTVVARLWAEHESGNQDHTSVLWTLLMFELWQREFIDAGPVSSTLSVEAE
ncbi:MAG: asparagine synthase-related protein, partial [Chloroflexota bacterium]